jgi:uncharacterized membrane protein
MEYLVDLVLLFFFYSFVGWCIEVTLKFFQYHRFINRGFLTGPCLPIYGSGCALITAAIDGLVLVSRYESSYGSVFAVSFVLCGVLEYLVSYFLEKRFHARWWDYSQKPMNLHGRVWIGNLILFGLGGVIVVKIANPLIYRLFESIPSKTRYITASVLLAILLTDYIVSHFVLKLVKDSVEKSEADNTEAIGKEVRRMLSDKNLFARRFANAYPEVIYRTEKVRARMEAIKAETDRLRKQAEDRLSAVQQQISDKLEPTNQIRNSVISNQDRLISRIYDPESADEESRELKQEIEKDLERLKNRRAF